MDKHLIREVLSNYLMMNADVLEDAEGHVLRDSIKKEIAKIDSEAWYLVDRETFLAAGLSHMYNVFNIYGSDLTAEEIFNTDVDEFEKWPGDSFKYCYEVTSDQYEINEQDGWNAKMYPQRRGKTKTSLRDELINKVKTALDKKLVETTQYIDEMIENTEGKTPAECGLDPAFNIDELIKDLDNLF